MSLFLTSVEVEALAPWLIGRGVSGEVMVIVNASRALADGADIVAPTLRSLANAGLRATAVDVTHTDLGQLSRAGGIVMTGGNPFGLLADLRSSGAAEVLRRAHHAGTPIAGQSAGAMVCAPDLQPVRMTSPFAPQADQDLRGLDLTTTLVLPHHDRPGRSVLHRQAACAHGLEQRLVALWDDEVFIEESQSDHILRGAGTAGSLLTRTARGEDAEAIEAIFGAATQAAWAGFLGAERLAAATREPALWAGRIATPEGIFLLTEDAVGPAGFVYARPLADDAAVAEVDLLYTHPRAWGTGIGRRLLERATWQLLCAGYREAVLWTEARNRRALAVYQANGWIRDGVVDERDYLGVPIRNLRHRLDLTRHGGG